MPPHAEDLAGISAVINLYSRAMDTRHFELMEQVFTPQAVIVLGAMQFRSRERGVAAIRACIDCCSLTHHMNSNIEAQIEGDRAEVRSCFRAWHQGWGAHAHEIFEALGTYEDRFVRSAAGWRIAQRVESSPVLLGRMSFFEAAASQLAALQQ